MQSVERRHDRLARIETLTVRPCSPPNLRPTFRRACTQSTTPTSVWGATVKVRGVVTVSVNLAHLDLNQCPQSFYTPNFFKNSAVCDFKNTYCEPIPGRRFRSGSYKCMCRQGFEYPFNDLSWFFDGETMEREYELKLLGKPSRYDLLKCRQGMATRIPISKSTILLLLALVWAANSGRP
ncbi:WD repeat-containing protein 7 [Sparganum proliferum]